MLFKRKSKPERQPTATQRRPVFSYYAQARHENSQNLHRSEHNPMDETRSFWRQLPNYVAGAVIVLAALYALWLKPHPKIVIISQPNTVHYRSDSYQTAINDIWDNSVLNQSKLTLDSRKIVHDIRERFPELSSVRVELPLLGQRANVIIVPSRPAMQVVNGRGLYYLDQRGKVLADVTEVQQNQLQPLPVVQDNADIDVKPGGTLLTPDSVNFLTELYAYLRASKFPIKSMELSSVAANQVDVRLENTTYYLKFNLLTEAREVVGSYVATEAHLKLRRQVPRQYVDMRVPEKVFYK